MPEFTSTSALLPSLQETQVAPPPSGVPQVHPTGRVRSWSTRASLLWKVLGQARRGGLYKLNYDITTRCNSRCLTCDVWKYYDDHPEDLSRELSLDEIGKVFSQLPESISWLSLTGGEPFIREDFGDLLRLAVDRIPGLRLIGIPSNGLTCDRMMRMLGKVLDRPHPLILLSLSIDGPERTHDRVRGVPGGFARTWATYERLREWTKGDRNVHLCIETTISRHNVDEVEPFLAELIQNGHDVTITVGHEGALYYSAKRESVSPEDRADRVEAIVRRVLAARPVRSPKDLLGREYLSRVPGYLRNPGKMVVPCASLQASASINHFGDVVPCLMWARPLGNLRDHGYRLESVLAGAPAAEARRMIVQEKCPTCWTPCEAYQTLLNHHLPFRREGA